MSAKFAFTKLSVSNLERSAAFYAQVGGYGTDVRLHEEMFGRRFSEILLTAEGGMSGLILMSRVRGEDAPNTDVVLGFSTNNAHGLLDAIRDAGGSVVVPATDRTHDGRKIVVGIGSDPDGHLIEVVQVADSPRPSGK